MSDRTCTTGHDIFVCEDGYRYCRTCGAGPRALRSDEIAVRNEKLASATPLAVIFVMLFLAGLLIATLVRAEAWTATIAACRIDGGSNTAPVNGRAEPGCFTVSGPDDGSKGFASVGACLIWLDTVTYRLPTIARANAVGAGCSSERPGEPGLKAFCGTFGDDPLCVEELP